jgi:hypothetical protein
LYVRRHRSEATQLPRKIATIPSEATQLPRKLATIR